MINKILKKIPYIILCITAIVSLYIYGLNVKPNGDNIEHMHTSWLIWQKNIPYKDFFQHHNPLIWYMFAPIVAFLINNIFIFKVFSVISFLTLLLIVLIQSKILKQLKVSKEIIVLFASIIISSYSVLWSTDYRPDTFMFLFFFAGVYYLFEYLKKIKCQYLVLSFLFFYLSFCCTQKVILNFLILGPYLLFLIYRKNIIKRDFIISIIIPLIITLLYILYLYFNDALEIYLKSCYLFNSKLASFFVESRIIFPPLEYFDIYLFSFLGLLSSIYFLIYGDAKERFLSILFIEELLLRVFYFSAFLHYNTMLIMLGIMLSFLLLNKLRIKKYISIMIVVLYVIFANFYNYKNTYISESNSNKFIHAYEYYFKNLTPCDYALNGYYAVNNLRAKDVGYYHILLGQIDILGEKLNIAPRDNINKLILTYFPKIITNDIYWNMYYRERNRKIPAHIIDNKIVLTYYQYSGIGNIYILKPEYQKNNCNYTNGKWEYGD